MSTSSPKLAGLVIKSKWPQISGKKFALFSRSGIQIPQTPICPKSLSDLHLNEVNPDFICYSAAVCDEVLKISAPTLGEFGDSEMLWRRSVTAS